MFVVRVFVFSARSVFVFVFVLIQVNVFEFVFVTIKEFVFVLFSSIRCSSFYCVVLSNWFYKGK